MSAVAIRPFASGPVRELSAAERFTWAECPGCKAKHGEACKSAIGDEAGIREFATDEQGNAFSAHFARTQRAPFKVREVPVQT